MSAIAEPRRRGRLVLPDKVVAKIAGQAASEVQGTGGTSGGVLGLGAHTDLSARPRVEVELAGEHVDLSLGVTVTYPTSIRGACAEVRDHVTRQVEYLTGLTVGRVDIEVTALHSTGTDDHPSETRTRSLR